jgi:transposase
MVRSEELAANRAGRPWSRQAARVGPFDHAQALYKQRNHIKPMFGQLKINRPNITRYDQLANGFLGMLYLATARYVHAAWSALRQR